MALSASGMASTIVDNLAADNPAITGDAKTKLVTYWTAICTGMINHIISDAQVMTNGMTGSGSPGGPLPIVSQPGTIS